MKYYDPKKCREYIEANKDRIKSVELGMAEDWKWTERTVFHDDQTLINMNRKRIKIGGIESSPWATPVMKVTFKDGKQEVVDCFFDDGNEASHEIKGECMMYAREMGGMSNVMDTIGVDNGR